MSEAKPIRCQKCGKPVGYLTVLGKSLLGTQQPVQNVKVVAVCMNCRQKKYTVT
jgi:Zn finger protein HypA/HybF involved in hydrogenase expression